MPTSYGRPFDSIEYFTFLQKKYIETANIKRNKKTFVIIYGYASLVFFLFVFSLLMVAALVCLSFFCFDASALLYRSRIYRI